MNRRTAPAPACTCGQPSGGHVTTCPLALHALRQVGGKAPARTRGKGRYRATPSTSRGVTFRSGLEREVFDELWKRREQVPGAEILRVPRFDLWRSWREGMGKPLCFTPDFLLVRPRGVLSAREPELVDDDVTARVGTVWREADLDVFDVEVHEAKTAKRLESRDYPVRLAAFRAEHPTWPFFEWRRPEGKKTGKTCERLPDLSSAPAPSGGA